MCPPRIAFLILAHQDAPQLERLCHALEGRSIFVHVDGRATEFPLNRIAEIPGTIVLSRRTVVHWGDFSMIEATLSLLERAKLHGTFDRFVLLSGSCYPVKPLDVLDAAFAKDPSREWISVTPIDRQSYLHSTIGRHWRMAPLLENPFFDSTLRRIYNLGTRAMGRDLRREIGMVPYFGSQWWALTDDCISAILEFVRDHPGFVRSYRSVYAPDEHFFQTIVANSRFASKAIHIKDQGSATNWLGPLHQIGPAEDRYFGNGDTDFEIAASTSKFFIRKVSSSRSAQLLERIDRELMGRKSAASTLPKSGSSQEFS